MKTPKLPKIAVLASGSGSNFEALAQATKQGQLTAEIVGLISNKPGVLVLERAKRLGIPSAVFEAKSYPAADAWNTAMTAKLVSWQADWIVLAGFTGLIGRPLLEKFPSRVVNSHPSLLPKYGGKGMYGLRVHAAVIEGGENETGISIHLVNERFDEGPILAQTRVPVETGDTAESLAERVQSVERKFYFRVLEELVTGRIKC